jgi:hypothetical protein
LPSDIQGRLRQRRRTRKATIAAAVGIGGLAIWLTLGLAPAGAQSEVDSQHYMAGIDSPKDARSFLEHLKAAARNKDNGALAALVRYPLAMYDNGKVIHIYRSRRRSSRTLMSSSHQRF